jgi:hypothetical protein
LLFVATARRLVTRTITFKRRDATIEAGENLTVNPARQDSTSRRVLARDRPRQVPFAPGKKVNLTTR